MTCSGGGSSIEYDYGIFSYSVLYPHFFYRRVIARGGISVADFDGYSFFLVLRESFFYGNSRSDDFDRRCFSVFVLRRVASLGSNALGT